MFVPLGHPLARARGAENVFVLEQPFAGRMVLHGEGAGPLPTAAAMLGVVLALVMLGTVMLVFIMSLFLLFILT